MQEMEAVGEKTKSPKADGQRAENPKPGENGPVFEAKKTEQENGERNEADVEIEIKISGRNRIIGQAFLGQGVGIDPGEQVVKRQNKVRIIWNSGKAQGLENKILQRGKPLTDGGEKGQSDGENQYFE